MSGLPTVLLSPVEAGQVRAATVVTLVVEGELCHTAQCSGCMPSSDHDCRCKGHYIEPWRWARVDGQRVTLTVECPTCGGTHSVRNPASASGFSPCRCHAPGIPLVTAFVTVTPAGDATHWNVTLEVAS